MRDVHALKLEIEKELIQPLESISIVNLVNLFVEYAYRGRASDVHIEPESNNVRIRFRVDGMLREIFRNIKVSKSLHQEMISRIKVISGLRTDEHSIPQDGRMRVQLEDANVDVRVSILPTYYGENAVLRLLTAQEVFDLESLGFNPVDLERVKASLKRTYGMILANGPTGSGKTTTLYTILKKIRTPDVSIITIEDPIEYSQDGATQIQVNNQVGLTFASGLRSILRQDPNIVMVGEIRDQETANIAVNAALTGHLVLSTLHTNDSATTFPRLMDMGVPPFLVASTINVAMGQRLVRRVCASCRKERTLSASEWKSMSEMFPEEVKKAPKTFYYGEGCAVCDGSGYQGRVGIREVLTLNDELRKLIMNRATAQEIKAAAVKNGMTSMLQDGINKAAEGLTTIEEVLRIINE